MGWTETTATYHYPNGTINRKAECDAYFMESLNRGYYHVVKSTMKGSTYYAAVMPLKRPKKDGAGKTMEDASGHTIYENIPNVDREIVGVVIRTYVRDGNFGYKIIDETCGPCYYDCPKSILDVLTETDSKYAIEWRKKCYETAKQVSISKLPIGTEIQFSYNGNEITLRKSAPMYQFKTPFWMNDANCTYFSKKRIPNNFKIVHHP